MRFLIAVLGTYGIYRFLRHRSRRGSRPLLQDMRTGARRRGDSGLRESRRWEETPPAVTYEVVQHDGGWAYKVGDVFSESYPTRDDATNAAEQAAAAHRSAGEDEVIQYQDREGRWHEEMEPGDDRPDTRVDQESTSRH